MGLIFTFYGVLALLTGYLLGSLPFGLLLTRWAGFGDRAQHRLGQYRRHQCLAHRA